MNISKNTTLEELTFSQTATRLKIKNVPNAQQIENLKFVTENVFEKIREHFGTPIRISSGFRCVALNKKIGGVSTSQHCKGEALDLQGLQGITNKDIFHYVKDNLMFDQLIWEYGTKLNPAWVHVSLRKTGNRKQILYIGVK